MADKACRFAVARTKALEVSLFSDQDIADLLSTKDFDSAIGFLLEKGWGNSESGQDMEKILKAETDKTWEEIHSMSMDMSLFAPLSYQRLYHNLNAAIKDVVTDSGLSDLIYYDDVEIPGNEMKRIIEDKDFYALPEHMRKVAQEALEVMLHTGDGQLCDSIVDRGALEAMERAAKDTNNNFLIDYAASIVSVADIRIALRAAKSGRTKEFLERAIAPTSSLNANRLKAAAVSGVDAVMEFLRSDGFAEAADAVEESNSAFERWCDNRIIATIKSQKYVSETPGPVIAYLLARENEIKTVRIILTCKLNFVPEEQIKERVRDMYV